LIKGDKPDDVLNPEISLCQHGFEQHPWMPITDDNKKRENHQIALTTRKLLATQRSVKTDVTLNNFISLSIF
jgi:hypothetical protein